MLGALGEVVTPTRIPHYGGGLVFPSPIPPWRSHTTTHSSTRRNMCRFACILTHAHIICTQIYTSTLTHHVVTPTYTSHTYSYTHAHTHQHTHAQLHSHTLDTHTTHTNAHTHSCTYSQEHVKNAVHKIILGGSHS